MFSVSGLVNRFRQQPAGVATAAPTTTTSVTPTTPTVASTERFETAPADMPRQMSLRELRELAAAQSPTATAKKPLDIQDIPFGMEIEMEGFQPEQARPKIEALPEWNVVPHAAHWSMHHDAALRDGGEAVSPAMTLRGGQAEEQIRGVFAALKALGGRASLQGEGFHIHVDASVLGAEGIKNLVKIAMENERMMYVIGKNGNAEDRGFMPGCGHRHATNHWYSQPLSSKITDQFGLFHADGMDALRRALYEQVPTSPNHPRPPVDGPHFIPNRQDSARMLGINLNSVWYRGTVEFRLFAGVDDPEQAMADLKMVLNLVKSAADGDYTYLQSSSYASKDDTVVPAETYNYFLSHAAGDDPKLRERLEQTFARSGGKIGEDTVSDPYVLHSAYLMQHGVRFNADGHDIASPFEVKDLIQRPGHALSASSPSFNQPVPVQGAQDLSWLVSHCTSTPAA